jgi:histone H4
MEGRGMGKRGIGMGGAKRHSKVVINTLDGIKNGAIRRLARKGGVKRLNRTVYDESRYALSMFLISVIDKAITYTKHRDKHTMTVSDVIYALKINGNVLYGYDIDRSHTRKKKRKNAKTTLSEKDATNVDQPNDKRDVIVTIASDSILPFDIKTYASYKILNFEMVVTDSTKRSDAKNYLLEVKNNIKNMKIYQDNPDQFRTSSSSSSSDRNLKIPTISLREYYSKIHIKEKIERMTNADINHIKKLIVDTIELTKDNGTLGYTIRCNQDDINDINVLALSNALEEKSYLDNINFLDDKGIYEQLSSRFGTTASFGDAIISSYVYFCKKVCSSMVDSSILENYDSYLIDEFLKVAFSMYERRTK